MKKFLALALAIVMIAVMLPAYAADEEITVTGDWADKGDCIINDNGENWVVSVTGHPYIVFLGNFEAGETTTCEYTFKVTGGEAEEQLSVCYFANGIYIDNIVSYNPTGDFQTVTVDINDDSKNLGLTDGIVLNPVLGQGRELTVEIKSLVFKNADGNVIYTIKYVKPEEKEGFDITDTFSGTGACDGIDMGGYWDFLVAGHPWIIFDVNFNADECQSAEVTMKIVDGEPTEQLSVCFNNAIDNIVEYDVTGEYQTIFVPVSDDSRAQGNARSIVLNPVLGQDRDLSVELVSIVFKNADGKIIYAIAAPGVVIEDTTPDEPTPVTPDEPTPVTPDEPTPVTPDEPTPVAPATQTADLAVVAILALGAYAVAKKH